MDAFDKLTCRKKLRFVEEEFAVAKAWAHSPER